MVVVSMDECTSIYIVLSLLETNESTSAVPSDFANCFVIKKVTNYEPVRKYIKVVYNVTPTQD